MNDLTIKVKVIKAILTHNTEIGSQMDPFVVLKMGTIQKRGKTFDQAGDMPVFDEQFEFPYQGNLTMFHLIVYDQDATIDDLVGEVQIDLKPIISQQYTPKKWYSLKYDGKKPAGKIMLEFQCDRDGLTQSQNQKIIKQLIKPNIHHIGPSGEPHVNSEIHSLNSRHRHHHNQQKVTHLNPPIHFNQPKRVFSFRDNKIHEQKYQQTPFYPNHPSNSHISTQILTPLQTVKDSLSSANNTQRYFPSYQTNSYPNNQYPQQVNTSTIFNGGNDQFSQQKVNYSSSINYSQPYINPNPIIYTSNNLRMIH